MIRKIFVVEDHALVVTGIRAILKNVSDLEVCGEAAGISEAYAGIGRENPDAVLLDLGLQHNESGFTLLKKLATEYPGLPVLVLSMHEELEYVERALQQGATGYLLKGETGEVLLEAIRTILRKEVYIPPALAGRLLGRLYRNPSREPGQTHNLTDREFEIFLMLGKGLAAKQIGEALGISVSTVDTHRKNIKTKLGVENNNELIRQAVKWAEKAKE